MLEIGPASYALDRDALGPALANVAIELHRDEETDAWLAASTPHGALKAVAHRALRRVMSDYDANAALDIHPMRVLGPAQWRTLLGEAVVPRALDVGAGDGQVTETHRALAEEVVTTETSARMAHRLRARGFVCHEADVTSPGALSDEAAFDRVFLLNVLDRTDRPKTLLRALGERLSPGGTLVASLPLPYRPHVHVGPLTTDPEELLPVSGATFEAQARALAETTFRSAGFEVMRFTRAPYLCRGDARTPLVALDDAIFVLRRA